MNPFLTNLSGSLKPKPCVLIVANFKRRQPYDTYFNQLFGQITKKRRSITAKRIFDNGTIKTSRFFSRALVEQLQPEQLIILGTSGSMWDVLCENLSADAHEQWETLIEAVESDSVTQA